jgi:hypothetical protein
MLWEATGPCQENCLFRVIVNTHLQQCHTHLSAHFLGNCLSPQHLHHRQKQTCFNSHAPWPVLGVLHSTLQYCWRGEPSPSMTCNPTCVALHLL